MSRDILTPEPYKFDDDFEQAVVALCVRSTKFWMRIGYALEPDLLPTLTARTCMRAARMVAGTALRPPSLARVRQRLSTLNDDGKLATDKLEAALRYLERAPASQDFEDAVAAELTPMLKRRYSQAVAMASAGEFSTGVSFEETKRLIGQLESVGEEPVEDDTEGFSYDSPDYGTRMSSVTLLEKLPWGIPEVDNSLKGGGIGRGCTVLLVGSTGAGKTRALIHAACTALRLGKSVCLATLEWSEEEVMAGITANLAGCSFDDAIRDPDRWRDVVLKSGVCRARFLIKWFRPARSTLDQIVSWTEQRMPDMQVLVIDYLDKLNSDAVDIKSNMAAYKEGMDISESWRLYCRARNIWSWSASQAQRRKAGGNKILGADDVGLSIGKAQSGDYMFTLNFDPETQMLMYGIKKVRWGRGQYDVGPIPHDWDRCRMCPLVDEIDVEIEDDQDSYS